MPFYSYPARTQYEKAPPRKTAFCRLPWGHIVGDRRIGIQTISLQPKEVRIYLKHHVRDANNTLLRNDRDSLRPNQLRRNVQKQRRNH